MSEWRPTPELRLATGMGRYKPAARLQQLWVRDGTNQYGHVIFAAEEEWRDVPIVELENFL